MFINKKFILGVLMFSGVTESTFTSDLDVVFATVARNSAVGIEALNAMNYLGGVVVDSASNNELVPGESARWLRWRPYMEESLLG